MAHLLTPKLPRDPRMFFSGRQGRARVLRGAPGLLLGTAGVGQLGPVGAATLGGCFSAR